MKRPSKAEEHLAQKLATLQKALKDYTDYCEQIAAQNREADEREEEREE